MRPGWKVNDCDVVLEHWVYDLESITNLAADPEWIGGDSKVQEEWIDMSRSTIHIGYDTTYLENGAIMNIAQK